MTVTAATTVLWVGSAVGTAPASAHVHAVSDNPVRGAQAIVTFSVPNESPTGAITTALTVALPDVASARTEAMPGWTAKLDRDVAAGTVRAVTWTATSAGGIGADQFGLFRISLTLPDTDTVRFPATQTYADGSVVKWDQPPLPDAGEPEHPAPTLTLAAGPKASPQDAPVANPPKSSPDNTARLLAGIALLVGALGVSLAVVRRRT